MNLVEYEKRLNVLKAEEIKLEELERKIYRLEKDLKTLIMKEKAGDNLEFYTKFGVQKLISDADFYAVMIDCIRENIVRIMKEIALQECVIHNYKMQNF